MKQQLPLSSFVVSGYRAIQHLELPELGRVNVFVGKNNVGKTALLEAIRLYRSTNPRAVIRTLIRERGGFSSARWARTKADDFGAAQVESLLRSVEALFYGSYSGGPVQDILIRSASSDTRALSFKLPWARSFNADTGADSVFLPDTPVIEVHRGDSSSVVPLESFLRGFGIVVGDGNPSAMFVSPSGSDRYSFGSLWDRAVEAGHAPAVEEALRAIVPDLARVYPLSEPQENRAFYLEFSNSRRPIPLKNMGDGTHRVFSLVLTLIRASDGVLLIDEIENGLHYSVLVEVWRALLLLADRLNVQIFATTHSWDCIRAYAEAAREIRDVEGMLHRLERLDDGQLRSVEFDEEDLVLVARQGIEVR